MNTKGLLIGSAVILGGMWLLGSFKSSTEETGASGSTSDNGYLITDVPQGQATGGNTYNYNLGSTGAVFPDNNTSTQPTSSTSNTINNKKDTRVSRVGSSLKSVDTGYQPNSYNTTTGTYTDYQGYGYSMKKENVPKGTTNILDNPLTKAVQSVQGKKSNFLTARSW